MPAALKMMDLLFLGPPPLIPGEDAKDYQQLLAAVTNDIKPVDFMETIWTRDIVDLQWDTVTTITIIGVTPGRGLRFSNGFVLPNNYRHVCFI